jgi:dolichyl-phosphate-mannose--protein O-mannosyl transferase
MYLDLIIIKNSLVIILSWKIFKLFFTILTLLLQFFELYNPSFQFLYGSLLVRLMLLSTSVYSEMRFSCIDIKTLCFI